MLFVVGRAADPEIVETVQRDLITGSELIHWLSASSAPVASNFGEEARRTPLRTMLAAYVATVFTVVFVKLITRPAAEASVLLAHVPPLIAVNELVPSVAVAAVAPVAAPRIETLATIPPSLKYTSRAS